MKDLPDDRLPIGVLVSGRGSNLQAILDACESGEVAARVVVVISNRGDAYGLTRARQHGVPGLSYLRRDYSSRDEQQGVMAQALMRYGSRLVVLAGYDQIVGSSLLEAFPDAIINIHPSLLPAFGGGLHAQRDALDYGVKISGCTVHFVTEDVDAGPIILQAAVPVLDDDTEDTLSERILEQEHRILPRAIDLVARGRVRVNRRRVSTTL